MLDPRIDCCHTDGPFLAQEQLTTFDVTPARKGIVPTLRFGFEFCLRKSRLAPIREWWGLMDSGAAISAIPAFWIRALAVGAKEFPDAELRRVRGLTGIINAPIYFASVSLNQRPIHGPRCARCRGPLIRSSDRRVSGHFCHACRLQDGPTAFPIAAVVDLDYPSFGRDLMSETLTVIDPWRSRTTVVGGAWGFMLGGLLRALPGTRLSPNQK